MSALMQADDATTETTLGDQHENTDPYVWFEAIYARCQHLVFRILYHRVNHYNDAEDILQDVFMAIFKILSNHPDKVPKNATEEIKWVLAITKNITVDTIRRSRTQKRRPGERIFPWRDTLHSVTDEQMFWFESRDELHVLLAATHDSERLEQVLSLCIDGHTQKEIATNLKVSERTVRRCLARIREVCRQVTE